MDVIKERLLLHQVKILTSILLAFLIWAGSLFPKTSMDELRKFPELLNHYHEHLKTENKDFNFLTFLLKHYTSGHAQSGHSKHGHPGLPYMHSGTVIFAFIIPIYNLSLSTKKFFTVFQQNVIVYNNNYSFIYFSSLLQPPRY